MVEFAARWDPRPTHLDPAAARAAGFRDVIACGVYVLALRSALVHRRQTEFALIAGLGNDSLELPHPVYAGDQLMLHSEVVEARPSSSKPDRGVVKMRDIMKNGDGGVVLDLVAKMMVRLRS